MSWVMDDIELGFRVANVLEHENTGAAAKRANGIGLRVEQARWRREDES